MPFISRLLNPLMMSVTCCSFLRVAAAQIAPVSEGTAISHKTIDESLVVARKTYGVDFSPYLNGQGPNLGTQIISSQLLARMQIIAPYTAWVRSFGSTHGLENTPLIAHQLGLKIAATAWISKDAAQNTVEINNLDLLQIES